MGRVKDWAIELMEQEYARAGEEAYKFHLEEIAKSRIVIEQLKSDIKKNISRFDYDLLQEMRAIFLAEVKTRPERLYF